MQNEIVREYPQIALEICKVLGGRIRKLHEKVRVSIFVSNQRLERIRKLS